ncbi:hypothetical protein C0J52_25719 [Blattella germanica]|nr:hypothetical protein C0J52_25719 [Blattella germanica]
MGKRRELSAEKRAAIVALHKAGHTMRQIAKQEHVSLGSVHYTVKRYGSTNSNKDRYRKGRPRFLQVHNSDSDIILLGNSYT